jgi:DNA-binding transcriptional LysR family regulator
LLIIRSVINSLFVAANNDPTAPPLQDLAIFAAVAEVEGFSAAARRLGLSKALVSVAVSRLEKRLGVRLLQRTTRRLSLTEAGAATLPHIQRSLVAAREAEEAATSSLSSPRGLLKVNAPMSFGLLQVVPALGAFARAYPDVRVDLVLDDRVLDLVEGGFDLAVRIGTLADSALISHPVGRSRNLLAAHPDYLARAGTPRTPADLASHAVLLYSLASGGPRWTFTRGKRSETVRVSGPLKANSSLALRQALLQGLGVARAPAFVIGEDLAQRRLVRVLPEWHLPDQTIHLLTTARDYVPRKTRAFIDFFRARIGDPPCWEEGLVADPPIAPGNRRA